MIQGSDGNLYGTTSAGGTDNRGVVFRVNINSHPAFFTGEVALDQGVYYLAFPQNGNIFGYYEYFSDPHFIYHFDLGFEYVFDAADGHAGVYLYDFKSGDFFYTVPVLLPGPDQPSDGYNSNGVRYFYNFPRARSSRNRPAAAYVFTRSIFAPSWASLSSRCS